MEQLITSRNIRSTCPWFRRRAAVPPTLSLISQALIYSCEIKLGTKTNIWLCTQRGRSCCKNTAGCKCSGVFVVSQGLPLMTTSGGFQQIPTEWMFLWCCFVFPEKRRGERKKNHTLIQYKKNTAAISWRHWVPGEGSVCAKIYILYIKMLYTVKGDYHKS